MRKLLAALAVLVALAAPTHADFVLNGTSLTTNKQDLFPTPVGANPLNYITAADYNAVAQAALDLRSAITGGTSGFALRLGDGSALAVGAAGTGAIRYNNSTHIFEQSLNGGAWTGFGGGSTGNWTFSGNNADLTGAGTMGIGMTTATAITIGSNAMSGNLSLLTGATLNLGAAGGIQWAIGSTSLFPTGDNTFNLGSASSRVATGFFGTAVKISAAGSISNIAQGATNTTGLTIQPNVADGASSIALAINSGAALTTTAKLVSFQNNAVEKASVRQDGLYSGVGFVSSSSTPACTLGSYFQGTGGTPSCTVVGNNESMLVTVVTGGALGAGPAAFTITLANSVAAANGLNASIYPADQATSDALFKTTNIYSIYQTTTTTAWTLNEAAWTATAGATYKFRITMRQY